VLLGIQNSSPESNINKRAFGLSAFTFTLISIVSIETPNSVVSTMLYA